MVLSDPITPNTVFFLGAGASTCAGYPTGAQLLPRLKEAVESSAVVNFRERWRRWSDFSKRAETALEKSGDSLSRLILNANPEIALSVLDLMEAALEWEDSATQVRGFAEAAEDVTAGFRLIEDYFQSEGRDALSEARAARRSLVQSLEWWFFEKHVALRQQPRASRDYLRTVLDGEGLASGDVIITTNWDAVAELTLGEDGRWQPFDGYGFARKLENGFTGANGDPVPLPSDLPRSSKTKVLKLHGSFGWREANDRLYLDYSEFLSFLPFQFGATTLTFRDAAAPALTARDESVLLYPSFLKRLRTPELLEVWHLAGEALRTATRVVAIGYSLPDADVAVRTLLLPLRFRALRGDVNVLVIDESEQTLQRWQDFLRGNAEELRMSVCAGKG